MASENRILIEVEVNAGQAAQNLGEVRSRIDQLKEAQKTLKKEMKSLQDTQLQGGKISENDAKMLAELNRQYATNAGDLRELTAQEKMYTAQVQIATQNNRKYGDSLIEMGAQLTQLKNEYRALSKADREGTAGMKLQQQIQNLDQTMKEADQSLGDWQRNVGHYQNALLGLNGNVKTVASLFAGGFKNSVAAATTAVKQFGKMLLTTPVGWIAAAVAVVVKVFNELRDAFKRNDDAGTALSVALSRLQPIVTAVRTAFDGLAKVVATVIGWVTKAATAVLNLIPAYREAADAARELVIAEDELEDKQRQASTEQAKRNKRIAELNKEARGNEKLTAKEREEIYKEMDELARQNMEQQMELAKEEYENLVERNKQKRQLSDEDKNRETEYYNKMIEAQTNYLNETTRIASREMQARKEQEAEEKRLEEERRRRAQEAARAAAQRRKEEEQARKEAAEKELAEMRKLQDLQRQLVADDLQRQRMEVTASYGRQIEDLKKRLETEENLTTEAKESLAEQIKVLEELMWKDLADIDEKSLQQVQETISKAEEDAAKRYDELKKERRASYEEESLEIANKFQEDLNAVYGNAVEIARIKQEQAEQYHQSLLNMDKETKDALFENEEQYKAAVLAAEAEVQQAREQSSDAMKAQITEVGQTMHAVNGALSSLFEAMAGDSEQYEKFKKAMAIVDATISLATTIAEATAVSVAGDSYTMAIRIATNVATITAQFASVIAAIKAASVPSAPEFAQGGIVPGHSYTGDKVPIRANSGEMILTAQQQQHLFELITSGMPAVAIDYTRIGQAVAEAMSHAPAPVLDYSEFVAYGRKVAIEKEKMMEY